MLLYSVMIREKVAAVQEHIARVCQKHGRDPQEILLVGVTKYATPEQMTEGIAAGLRHIGENYVRVAQEKFSALPAQNPQVTKHLIGHLQTNKVKDAVELFDMIQTVDSVKLAREIDKRIAQMGRRAMDILIEVNTSAEPQKYGVKKADTVRLLSDIFDFEHLNILGLMTMAPYTKEESIVRQCFRDLSVLRDEVEREFQGHPRVEMRYLSMGMSGDYAVAIEEGSNMLRIGSAIFG